MDHEIIFGKITPGVARVRPENLSEEMLPFVGRDNTKRGSGKLSYWNVKSSGKDYDDGILGLAYALEALQYLTTHQDSKLLVKIITDMPKNKFGEIENSFFRTIASFAAIGATESVISMPKDSNKNTSRINDRKGNLYIFKNNSI